MNNIVTSFFDNIKEKTSNPFFGTLIFVWLVRNWELVFTLFNFDSDCTLDDKKIFIRGYYFDKTLWIEILINIGIAFGLMLLGYVLIVVSRLVVNVTNHNIIPRMNEKTVSKLVVNKSRFETVKKSRDEYFRKIEELEEFIIGLEQKNSLLKNDKIELENKSKEREKDLADFSKESKEKSAKYEIMVVELAKIKKENDINKNLLIKYEMEYYDIKTSFEELNNIFLEDFGNFNNLSKYENNLMSKVPQIIKDTYIKLKKENLYITFYSITDSILNDEVASYNDDFINKFIKLNLVRFVRNDLDTSNLYGAKNIKITELGILLRKLRYILSNTIDLS